MKKYYGKILIFGEYTVITGSHALAVPLTKYYGQWQFTKDDEDMAQKQQQLVPFADYLLHTFPVTVIDSVSFKRDLQNGLYFHSTIPPGYGAGSSGAVCAAIYDRYGKEKTRDLGQLQAIFIKMENYFHGSSSGTDPLVSYLNQPVLIENIDGTKNISILHFPKKKLSVRFFLIDTGEERQTASLVEYFLERYKNSSFFARTVSRLTKLNNLAIRYLLNFEDEKLWQTITDIHEIQFAHFRKMIPGSIDKLIMTSKTGETLVKLCGAGGGGFFLGIARDDTEQGNRIWL